MKQTILKVIALALGMASIACAQTSADRSTALAAEALKMIRYEHQSIESGQPLKAPVADAVELFHKVLKVDPSCLTRFVNFESGDCENLLKQFLKTSRDLPLIADDEDPASVILRALGKTDAFTQRSNPLIVGYQAAFLLNMEELRDATTMQELIAFLAAIDCPLTFRDLGLDSLSEAQLQDIAQHAASEVRGDRFYETKVFNFYLTLVRLDRWGSRDKGQRNGWMVAGEMMEKEEEFISRLLPGLAALPPATVVFFGDSDTDAIHWSSSAHYPEIVAGVFQRINPQVRFINAGVGGDDTGEALMRIKEDVLAHQPDYCFIMFGGNDSRHHSRGAPKVTTPAFVRNLAEMVVLLEQANCVPVFMSTHEGHPSESDTPDSRVLLQHIEAMEALAGILSVPSVTPRKTINGSDVLSMYAMDNVHLSERGQKVLARYVLEFLSKEGERRRSQASQ